MVIASDSKGNTLCVIHSVMNLCFVLVIKFLLPIGLHSSCMQYQATISRPSGLRICADCPWVVPQITEDNPSRRMLSFLG